MSAQEQFKDVSLSHYFLMGTENMRDPRFAGCLIFIWEHSNSGALGIVVNRPIDMSVGDLLGQLKVHSVDPALKTSPVYWGGPVQSDRGFVLHRPIGNWQSSVVITDDLALTTSRDVLDASVRNEGPVDMLITLGYAEWTSGQLEAELQQNVWITVEANDDVLFLVSPDKRLGAALSSLGIDLSRMSRDVGHA